MPDSRDSLQAVQRIAAMVEAYLNHTGRCTGVIELVRLERMVVPPPGPEGIEFLAVPDSNDLTR